MSVFDSLRLIVVAQGLAIFALVWLLVVLVRDIARERKAIQKRQRELDFVFLAVAQRQPPERAAVAMRIAEEGDGESKEAAAVRNAPGFDATDEMQRPEGMSERASRLLDEAGDVGYG